MPVTTSTAFNSCRSVTALVRALLNDGGTLAIPVGIQSIQRTTGNSTVTVTTLAPHNLVPGDFVVVSGVPTGVSNFNTTFQVLTVAGLQFTAAQAGVNDTQTSGQVQGLGIGGVWTDSRLMPFVNANYQMLQRELENIGAGTMIADDMFLVVPAVSSPDPGVQVVINDATAPPNQLPTDLQVPDKLWERTNGSVDDFFPMVDLTNHGGLPSRPQGQMLNVWEWRGDGLYFIGATQDVQIRLRYIKNLADLVDGTSSTLLRSMREAIAYPTAMDAALSRGSPMATNWAAKAELTVDQVLNAAARRMQHTNYRPRSYSRRRGFTPF